MPHKTDRYASPLHRRIDLILLLLTVVIFAIVLRTSAHGHTTSQKACSEVLTLSDSTAPQPNSTLED